MATRPLGTVADFCPICHDLQPHVLTREPAPGRPTESAFIATCSACGTRYNTTFERFLTVMDPAPQDIRELFDKTIPHTLESIAQVAFQERLAAQGKLAPADRVMWLRHPFTTLKYLSGPILGTRDIAMMATILAVVLTFASGFVVLRAETPGGFIARNGGMIVVCCTIGSFAASLALMLPLHKRWTAGRQRNHLEPPLATALRPLRPSIDELREINTWLKVACPDMHAAIDMDALHSRLKALPDRSLNNIDLLVPKYPILGIDPEQVEAANRGEQPGDLDAQSRAA